MDVRETDSIRRVDAVHVRQLERNELQVIELARGAKQNASLVRQSPLLGMRRPRCIAHGKVEMSGIPVGILLPRRHGIREIELIETLAEKRLKLRA